MDVAEKILELMEINNVSAYKLSKDLKIAQSSISAWKTGQGQSYMKYLPQLADYFGVPVGYLVGDSEDESTTRQLPISKKVGSPSHSRLRSVARLEEANLTPEQDAEITHYIDYLLSEKYRNEQ